MPSPDQNIGWRFFLFGYWKFYVAIFVIFAIWCAIMFPPMMEKSGYIDAEPVQSN